MYSLVIVDDEEELLEGLAQNFPWEKHGFFVVDSFSNARSALVFFENHTVDVLLTDIHMPFISGLELIQTISQYPNNHTAFCIISAYDDFAYAQEAIRQGVKYYLLKPTSFEEIERAFRKIREELDGTPLMGLTLDVGSRTDNPLVDTALAMIDKHVATCSLQSIADTLGLNVSYLSRLFKEKTGKNFQEYAMDVKMKNAAKLLESSTEISNKEIAVALGYQDVQNFCRCFKRKYNMTPKDYQKRLLLNVNKK